MEHFLQKKMPQTGSMSFRVESNGLNLRVWARTGLRAGA